ncbi:MAG TPA: PQQ-binding-like beta-propeller repeat protein [Ktedonobacteraceae bacterium]
MQPFDDLLPDEMDPQNEEIVTFLREAYGISGQHAAEPEPQQKALALVAVRQRLLETQQAQLVEESVPAPPDLSRIPVSHVGSGGKVVRRRRWERRLALLVATLCVLLLIGSLLTVFGSLRRGAQDQTTGTRGSAQTASRWLYVLTSGWLQKIDAASGVLDWQVQLPQQQQSDIPPMNFPLVGNGAVYVTVDNTLLAFNAAHGEQLWSVKLQDGSADAGAMDAQPVLTNGRLYLALQIENTDGVLSNEAILDALNASSGHVLWRYHPTGVIQGIVVDDDTVYVSVDGYSTNLQHELVALDATDGSQKWRVKSTASDVPALGLLNADHYLVVKNGVIYQLLSSPACGVEDGSCIFASRADNGALLWHSPDLVPASFTKQNEFAFWFQGGLIAAGKALYFDSSAGLYAIDATNGRLLWRQSEGSLLSSKPANHPLSEPFAGKGNPGTSFVVVGSTIFRIEMTGQGNYMTTLQAGNGKVIARKRIEDFARSGSARIKAQQYVGTLLLEGLMAPTMSYVFPSVGQLDALDNRTGARLWSIPLAGGGPAVLMLAPE